MKVPVSYQFNKECLSGKYLETFEHIESYCRTKLMSERELEDRMGYLLDIFVTAQENNLPVSKITGDNTKEFCIGFMKDSRPAGLLNYIAELFKGISWVSVIVFALSAVFSLMAGAESIWDSVMKSSENAVWIIVGAGMGVIGEIISNIIIRGFIFKVKNYRAVYHKIVRGAVNAVVIIGIMAAIMCGLKLNIPDGILYIAGVLYLLGFYIIRGIINLRSGRKFFFGGEKYPRANFSHMVLSGMVEEFRKMYASENKKRAKKGKPEMTEEEFNQKLEKENKTAKTSTILCLAVIGTICLYNIIKTALESSVEDSVFFAFVLLAALAVVYALIIHTLVVYPYLSRKKFFEILEENGKTVFDEDVYECINKYYDNEL